ncbi:MAG: hypothetical protein V3T72_09410 [Thermoanaerobaculia bacterium]
MALLVDGAGGAEVTYQARWHTAGTMSGFYFQGTAGVPRFTGGVAELPDGSNVPLSIDPLGGRWDIVLADGRRWGPGEATYTFTYETDLAAPGMMAPTTSPEGEPLVVLNWAPVEWDEPLEHETVAVRFASVPAGHQGDLGLELAAGLGLRTEPWVNQRYLITYRGAGEPPGRRGADLRGDRGQLRHRLVGDRRQARLRRVGAPLRRRRGAVVADLDQRHAHHLESQRASPQGRRSGDRQHRGRSARQRARR